MNEYHECMDLLENGLSNKNLYQSLHLLSRYYFHELGLNNYEIYIKLKEFLINNVDNYSDKKFKNILEYYSEVHKAKLSKIDKIEIFQSEFDIIQKLPNKKLKNLAFTLLCVAKYNYKINPNNGYWTNLSIKQISNLSKVKEKNEILYNYIHELYLCKLIKFNRKICSTNILVLFATECRGNRKPIFEINSFDNIIKEFNNYIKHIKLKST